MPDQIKVNTGDEIDVKHKNMLSLIDRLIELYEGAYNMCDLGDYDKCMGFIENNGMLFGICNTIHQHFLRREYSISEKAETEFIQWFMKDRLDIGYIRSNYYCHVPYDYIYTALPWKVGSRYSSKVKIKSIIDGKFKETFKLRLDRLIEAKEHYKTKLSFVL